MVLVNALGALLHSLWIGTQTISTPTPFALVQVAINNPQQENLSVEGQVPPCQWMYQGGGGGVLSSEQV